MEKGSFMIAAMNFAAALTFPSVRRLAPPQTSPAA